LIGGPDCTLFPEKSFMEYGADICVAGEGELIINSIAKYLGGSGTLSNIPGVVYKVNDKIKFNKASKPIKELDALLFPDRGLVEKNEYGYFGKTKLTRGKTTSILTSRGCPCNCTFCGYSAICPSYFERSVGNVVDEFEEIKSQGYKTVIINDNNFLANKKRVSKLLDIIIEKNLDLNLWVLGARADSAEDSLWYKMKKAGVKFISFGLESGNQEILDFYDKRTTIKQILNAVNLSKKMNFITSGSFIIGAPNENREQIMNTIKFAKSLELDVAHFLILSYIYGSKLWKDAVDKDLIPGDEYGCMADSKLGLGSLRLEELTRLCQIAYNQFYFNPKYVFRQCTNVIKYNNISLLKVGLQMVIEN
jgi:anaerobic magnesium-protoporphyrin IX monomethyl ester cyclase